MSISSPLISNQNIQAEFTECISTMLSFLPYNILFQPNTSKLAVAGGTEKQTGIMQMFSLSKGELNLVTEIYHPSIIKSSTFKHSSFYSQEIAIGGFDGSLANIDIEKGIP